ncbi:hypothetical protein [Yersinia rohdei]|nr:hypothetical protein [Yersinia rohdei]
MTRPELDGYLNALARLHGKKPSAGNNKTTTSRRVKSKRQKRGR